MDRLRIELPFHVASNSPVPKVRFPTWPLSQIEEIVLRISVQLGVRGSLSQFLNFAMFMEFSSENSVPSPSIRVQ